MDKKEKIIEIINVLGDEGRDKMVRGLLEQFHAMAVNGDPTIDADLLKRVLDKFADSLPTVLSTTEDQIVAVYDRHLSETEVDDLLSFYRSESGISIVEKLPVVQLESYLIYSGAASLAFEKIMDEEIAAGPQEKKGEKEWN